MKKFANVLVGYFIIISCIMLLINSVFKYKLNDTYCVPDEIQICNVGSSHGVHSYYYEDLEKKYVCYNFALDSQQLSYDRRMLEAYQDKLSEDGVVIIDVSFFSFFGKNEENIEEFESKNKRYYKILPPALIKEWNLYSEIMEDKLESLSVGIPKLFKVLISKRTEHKSYPDVFDTCEGKDNVEDAKLACNRHIFKEKRDDTGQLIYNWEEIDELKEMVKICRANNVTPILVTVPYLREYTEEIENEDPQFMEIFYGLIDNITQELDVDYYDFSSDERFVYDYSLFYNVDHMNSFGAKKFTKILYEEVIQKYL